MSDLEYDVLDELYFVQSFAALMETTDLEEKELRPILLKLLNKGWIRCYSTVSDEVSAEELDFELEFRNYFYLASKAGLLAHNSN
ncbi:MAG: transporter [Cyclobacteriaceae bacterium]